MSRERMGPPASEPTQRDYHVSVHAPDGSVLHVAARSHHALDAAREVAAARHLAGPRQEYVGAGGAWCIAVAGYELRSVVDTPHERVRFAEAFPGSAAPRSSRVTDAREGTDNDERAATQRRIADAIRCIPSDEADVIAEGIELLAGKPEHTASWNRMDMAVLAACARSPIILDAVRQVAQVHRLQDRKDEPTEGG